jgi:hypothetical protein
MVHPFVGMYAATILGLGAVDRRKYGSTMSFRRGRERLPQGVWTLARHAAMMMGRVWLTESSRPTELD